MNKSRLNSILSDTSEPQLSIMNGWRDKVAGLAAAGMLALPSSGAPVNTDTPLKKNVPTSASRATKDSLSVFLNALHQVESNGKTGHIVGDNGKALGPFQIHYSYWNDVKDKVGGKYEDVENLDYAKKVVTLLENSEIRASVDNRNETIGRKIREAEVQKYPYMLIVGDEEEKNGTISVRKHGQEGKGNATVTIEEFVRIVNEEISKTLKTFEV